MRPILRILPALGVALLLGACAGTPAEKSYPASSGMAPSQSGADAATAAANSAGAAADRRVAMAAQAPRAADMPSGPIAERTIYFGYDDFVIDSGDADLLSRHARYLSGMPNAPVRIEGHADERGSVEYNLALGQRRAEAVRRALTTLGLREAMIESVSWGEQKPVAAGGSENSWARNRRAEIVYSGK